MGVGNVSYVIIRELETTGYTPSGVVVARASTFAGASKIRKRLQEAIPAEKYTVLVETINGGKW